jgi:hypothetical protein
LRGRSFRVHVVEGRGEIIVARKLTAGAAKPSPEVAAHYADRLIATLGIT